jgi:glutaminase
LKPSIVLLFCQEFRQVMSGFCNKDVQLDEEIYKSESATAARNRQIADILLANGICMGEYDKEQGLESYFMMCSTLLNTVDLACLAATAANHGINPISKKHIVNGDVNEEMMSVMMTCGMYNGAGNWMVDVGIPAKSGVGGGIFGVVPGVCGIAVFSPRLNPTYNSVRGIMAFMELSQRLGLHVLQKKKSQPKLLEVLTRRRKPRFSNSQVAAGVGVNRVARTQSAVWGKGSTKANTSFRTNSVVPGMESLA